MGYTKRIPWWVYYISGQFIHDKDDISVLIEEAHVEVVPVEVSQVQ
jgi:hypothetical protein